VTPTDHDTAHPDLEVRALTPSRFDDVVDLFGTRGDPSWCWCQFFLTTGSDYTASADDNREELRAQAARRPRPGLLAYADGRPVGWVQVGPRPTYPRLTQNRALVKVAGDDIDDPGVWAVTCFVVKVGHRRRGIGAALLEAAVRAARDAGARVLEGHPVDVAARGGRSAGADLYHGALSTFLAAGFEEVGRTGPSRPVVRLDLRQTQAPSPPG
jgi:GNAT superfamily N-acetyltransferase